MTHLRLSVTICLRKITEDDLNERDDYGVQFSEHARVSLYLAISLCSNANPLIIVCSMGFGRVLFQ